LPDWTSQAPFNSVAVSYVRAPIASSDIMRLKSCLKFRKAASADDRA
jgi:hypothetical protein